MEEEAQKEKKKNYLHLERMGKKKKEFPLVL